MCVRKSAFYSYNFHIFRLFGFGKEEGDVYRFMITMWFCHDHQRRVIYVLSYDLSLLISCKQLFGNLYLPPLVQGVFTA